MLNLVWSQLIFPWLRALQLELCIVTLANDDRNLALCRSTVPPLLETLLPFHVRDSFRLDISHGFDVCV